MHWLIIGRDRPNMEEKRLAARQEHRAYIWRDDLPAKLSTGAPLADDSGKHMCGTWLLVEAPDRAAVEAFQAGDPYHALDLFGQVDILPLFDAYDASVILPPAHKRPEGNIGQTEADLE